MTQPYAMIIIGGGIIGAAFAYAAARRDIGPIMMIDAGPGQPAPYSATAQSWGWVNAATDNDETYFRLRHASMQTWNQWIASDAALFKSGDGGFLWDLPDDALDEYVRTHAQWGYAVEVKDRADLARQMPWLRDVPAMAAFCPDEFALEPAATAATLRMRSGANLHNAMVDGFICDGARVTGVTCGADKFYADEIVIAAGNDAADLLAGIDVSLVMAPTMGLLVTSNPVPQFLSYLVTAADYHVRQLPEGALLIGGRFNQDVSVVGGDYAAAADELVDRISVAIDVPAPLKVAQYTLGTRVIPKGGLPVIGRFTSRSGNLLAGLYGAVMHSGVTNAAGVAERAIDDMLSGGRNELLRPYQPQGA